jgi:hypothetical protein
MSIIENRDFFCFSASQTIEKHREFNIPTYVAFIDFKKSL